MSYLKVYSDEVDIGWLIFMFIYLVVKYENIDLVCICRKDDKIFFLVMKWLLCCNISKVVV